MYAEFYGLAETPFNLTPDSKYFFASEQHRSALDSLMYGINERKGFILLTGEVGSGKTTVCRSLLQQFDASIEFAVIRNTNITAKDLVAMTLEDLEIDCDRRWTKSTMLQRLNRYLIEQLVVDHKVVLIVDEAQNLSFSVLEEIRMLSNLETDREKLIQIILIGQPQLRNRLLEPALEQLRQRITVSMHLGPMDRENTHRYIQHRVRVALRHADTSDDEQMFSADALDEIYDYSQGVPRLINAVCDAALLAGYADNTKPVTGAVVREAACDILHAPQLLDNTALGLTTADASVGPRTASADTVHRLMYEAQKSAERIAEIQNLLTTKWVGVDHGAHVDHDKSARVDETVSEVA